MKKRWYHLDSFQWEIWFYMLSRREGSHPTMKNSSTMILYWLEHPQPLSPHLVAVCAAPKIPVEQVEWSICNRLSPTWSSQLLGSIAVILSSIVGRWNEWGRTMRGLTRELVSSLIFSITIYYTYIQQEQRLTSPDLGSQGYTQSQSWCSQVQNFGTIPFCQSFLPVMALCTHENSHVHVWYWLNQSLIRLYYNYNVMYGWLLLCQRISFS